MLDICSIIFNMENMTTSSGNPCGKIRDIETGKSSFKYFVHPKSALVRAADDIVRMSRFMLQLRRSTLAAVAHGDLERVQQRHLDGLGMHSRRCSCGARGFDGGRTGNLRRLQHSGAGP